MDGLFITFIPDEKAVKTAIDSDECIIAAISFNGAKAYAAPEENFPEHYLLLHEAGLKENDIDLFFRIRFDRQSAAWTFTCPDSYESIIAYYTDGMRIIPEFLRNMGYEVPVVIPERYIK